MHLTPACPPDHPTGDTFLRWYHDYARSTEVPGWCKAGRAVSVPVFSLPTLSVAGLILDATTRTIEVEERPSQRLTHLEFRLLYTLMVNRGQVLPPETIVERVWGYSGRGGAIWCGELISRLRAKVEVAPSNPQYILTVPGVGYSFRDEALPAE